MQDVDYRTLIIKMLEKIDDEAWLRRIYLILIVMLRE